MSVNFTTFQFRKDTEVLTDRFRLRAPDIKDRDFFIRLYGNKDVMKHIPPEGEPVAEEEAIKRFDRLIDHWKRQGYGMFVIEQIDTGVPIGYCGLRFLHEVGKIELGYIIDQPYWGSGVASEAAAACVRYARDTLNADGLVSVTNPTNFASQKILLKLGFERSIEYDGIYHGMHHCFFSLDFSS